MNTSDKKHLRQKYRALRDSFGEEFIENASDSVCEKLAKCQEFKDAKTVLLYYPTKNEISTLPIFELCLKMGKTVAFPVCRNDNSSLLFRKINRIDSLLPSSFGLLEPSEDNEQIHPDKSAICIVPALAFSRNGHRLGYGRGFYDRFLTDFEGVTIGICYSSLVVDALPSNRHDVPVDILITESEVHYIAQKN